MVIDKNLLIAAALVASASQANAGHAVIYGASTGSFASAQAHQGPNVVGSTANVRDMTVTTLAAGNGGSASHDALSPVRSGVSVTQPGGAGNLSFGSNAGASADLATGRLKANVGAYGPNNFGSPAGFATAELSDTLFFTNTSGGDLSLTFRFSFDGSVIDSNGDSGPGGTALLRLGCDGFRCYNANGAPIRFAGSGTQVGDDITAFFDENGIQMFARNIYGDQNQLFDHFDVWQQAAYGSGGAIDGWMQATLLIPTGETSLGILGRLNLDCRGGSNCDFGHTGQFGFVGALPAGLSFGSASSVFLSAGAVAPGVPEPASWALLIAGFGLIGATLRRRRATRVAAA